MRRIEADADPQRAVDEAAAWLTAADALAAGGPVFGLPAAASPERVQAVRTLLIVDGPRLRPGSSLAFRRAIGADASAIVVDGPPPNLTTTLVEFGPDGTVTQADARTGRVVHGASPAALDADDAHRCARMLARLDDPLVADRAAPLPTGVRLSDLVPFDLGQPSDRLADAIRAHWSARRDPGSLAIAVGVGEDGPFELDIVRHGPHGLLGGATGSGKSELLKMIVAGLAARYSPDEVIIGLFDFKGGTSLQELTRLPHCVGLVSDTDLHEAERALRYLRTELLRRERLLFARGAAKIEQIAGELPRLIVIIDEFQILADELPDELQTVIDLTKRGRSLGVHLLFATQSPASVRNYDEIKRNTQLRMTLKLLDVEDSVRLIDLPDAARFTVPGRGLARVDNQVLAFQAGFPSGSVEASDDDAVRLEPFTLLPAAAADTRTATPGAVATAASAVSPGAAVIATADIAGVVTSTSGVAALTGVAALDDEPWWQVDGTGVDDDEYVEAGERTELGALIAGVRRAYRSALDRRQLRPVADVWPPALPVSLAPGEVVAQARAGEVIPGRPAGLAAYFARADRPDESEHARQPAVAWHLDAGNLLVFGGDEVERQVNLLAYLRARIARLGALDAAGRAAEAQAILLIDNLGGFLNAHEAVSSKQGIAVLADFAAVIGAGPASKVAVAASIVGTRVRNEVAARAPQRLILRLPDHNAYADLDIERRSIPRGVPGRGLWTTGNDLLMEVQVATPDAVSPVGTMRESTPEALPTEAPAALLGFGGGGGAGGPGRSPRWAWADGARAASLPRPIRALPATIEPDELTADGGARLDDDVLVIPLGLATQDGAVVQVCLDLAEGSPALVYGPPRYGKSTLLRRLAELTRASLGDAVAIYAAAAADSPLAGCPAADRVRELDTAVTLAQRAAGEQRPTLLLIDDVTRLGDSLNAFLQERHPRVRLVATARVGELRTADYTGSASRLKSAPTRLVLEPEPGESDPVSGRYLTYPPSGPGRGRGFLLSASGTRFVQT